MNLAVVAALLVAMVFAGTVSAMPAQPLSPDVPSLPHCFWGTVSTNRGIPLPGTTVVARAVAGYWTGQVSTTVTAQSQYSLCVPGYSAGTGAKAGDLIGFFVNGVPALLVDVATGSTYTAYPFAFGGTTQLNLFVSLQETIEATAGPNCTITPAGSVRVDYGMDQTFTFAGAPGYQVEQLFVDDVANPTAAAAGSFTFPNVRRSHTIRVECIKSTWTITATAGEGCTITPSGAQTVPVHTNFTFTIGAQTGYNLTDVTVDGTAKGPVTTYTFNDVTADHAIAAACTRQSFTITPEWGTGGKIVPGTPQTVLYGGNVTFQIQPDSGYMVEDVLVNGVSTGAITTYTFTNVTANGTIKATFKLIPAPVYKIFLPVIFG